MKKAIAMLLALTMVFALVACGGQAASESKTEEPAKEEAAEEPAKEEAAEEAPAEEVTEEEAEQLAEEDAAAEEIPDDTDGGEPVTIKFAAFEGGYGSDHWNKIIEAFEAQFPNIKVELTTSPTIDDIVRPQMVAGEYPDVFLPGSVTSPLYSSMLTEGQLLDIKDIFEEPGLEGDGNLKDQIIEGFLGSSACDPNQDGSVLCAPISVCTRGMIYNKALFAEKGWEVPETWDEFFALGDVAKEEGIALMTYAGIYPDYLDTLIWPSIASAKGADYVYRISRREEGLLEDPDVMQIFKNIARIGQEGYLLEGTPGMNHTQTQSEFILNKCLFCPNGDWLAEEMQDAPHAEGFEYGLTPAFTLEKGQDKYTRSTPEIIVIPKNAEHPDEAKQFIRFLYTDAATLAFAESGILHCTKNAVELTEGMFTEAFSSMHEVDSYAHALVFTWVPDADGSRIILHDEVYNPIADVMNGQMSAEDWVAAIEAAFAAANSGE